MSQLAIDLRTDYAIEEINNIDIHLLDNTTRETVSSSVITELSAGDYIRGERLITFSNLPDEGLILVAYRVFLRDGDNYVISDTISVPLANRNCRGRWVFRRCTEGITTTLLLVSRR